MSSVETIDPVIVPLLVYEVQVQQNFCVAITAVLVYHSVLRLEEEIKYFWRKPCNVVGVIFFINKYSGILGAILNITYNSFDQSFLSCLFSYWITGILNWANILLIDYILTIRVLALYEQDRRLTFFLRGLLAAEAVSELALLIYGGVVDEVFVGELADGMTVCLIWPFSLVSLGVLSWAIPMLYGLVLLVLSLYKAAGYWKMSRNLRAFPLVKVLVKDQVIYYIFVIVCCVMRIVVMVDSDNFLVTAFINAAGNPSFLSLLGSHLLINLKKEGEKEANGGVVNASQSVSAIAFA